MVKTRSLYLTGAWFGTDSCHPRRMDGQAGSRCGSRCAMLRTYTWLKLSQTDTQMDRWMD